MYSYKINDYVSLDDGESHSNVKGHIIGTFSVVKNDRIYQGFMVNLDPDCQGFIHTENGHKHGYISMVAVTEDNLSLVDNCCQ